MLAGFGPASRPEDAGNHRGMGGVVLSHSSPPWPKHARRGGPHHVRAGPTDGPPKASSHRRSLSNGSPTPHFPRRSRCPTPASRTAGWASLSHCVVATVRRRQPPRRGDFNRDVLAAERILAAVARHDGRTRPASRSISRCQFGRPRPAPLNLDQAALVEQMATSGRRVRIGAGARRGRQDHGHGRAGACVAQLGRTCPRFGHGRGDRAQGGSGRDHRHLDKYVHCADPEGALRHSEHRGGSPTSDRTR